MKVLDIARASLTYDPETGVLVWVAAGANRKTGRVAGGIKRDGYRHVKLAGKMYLAHRLVWLIVFGEWPAAEIDHINGKRDDNRLVNLRPATRSQNMQNREANGVLRRPNGRWYARIGAGRQLIPLGTFDSYNEARSAYLAAKANLHTFQPVPRGVA